MFILSKKKLLILVIIIILLIVGVVGIYYGRAVKIKMFGTRVKPSRVYKPREVKFFLENDPQWSSDRLGDSEFS